jgi:UDP-glucose:(heptosyl)LPS alpha-1,3-glucosyltransferase
MKIAMVIYRAEYTRGGAERYTIDLADELIRRGHDVSIVSTSFDRSGHARQTLVAPRAITRATTYARFATEAAKVNADIVHAMCPIDRCDVYHCHAGLELENFKRGRWRAFFNRRRFVSYTTEQMLFANPSTHVIALNQRMHDLAAGFVKPHRLHLIHSRVPFTPLHGEIRDAARRSIRQSLSIGDAEPTALFIGNDFARKGLDHAVATITRNPDWRLIVVGSGSVFEYLRNGDAKRIHCVGPQDDAAKYYAASDVLVLPARVEPFGMVVTEAMSSGVVSLVSQHVGAKQVIREGHDGFICPLDEPGTWDKRLDMLKHHENIEQLKHNCLSRADEFSYSAHVDQIESLYQKIVGDRS